MLSEFCLTWCCDGLFSRIIWGGKMVFGTSLVKIACLIAVRLSCARLSLSIILACQSDKVKLHTENISEEG